MNTLCLCITAYLIHQDQYIAENLFRTGLTASPSLLLCGDNLHLKETLVDQWMITEVRWISL
jgi:hypothetical protein